MKNNKGFTLIELLVVIAIIGILASVILASLNSARSKGRDAYRVQSISNLQSALEMYYDDNYAYPSTGGQWWGNCSSFGSHPVTGATGYIPNLAPQYFPTLPIDPQQTASNCILYRSDGINYFLMAYNSYEGTVPASRVRPSSPTSKTYAVYTPGAASW